MMQEIFQNPIDHRLVVRINNILIYSKTQAEQVAILHEVLPHVKQWNLVASLKKCQWHRSSVNFPEYIISDDRVAMSDETVPSILQWKAPRIIKDVQVCLGFAAIYRRFIEGYLGICKPMTDTTKTTLPTGSPLLAKDS